MNNLISYLIPLSLTLLIETPLAAVLERNKKFILSVILVNIITNPAANAIARTWPQTFFATSWAIPTMEIIIVLIEWGMLAFLYRKKYLFLFFFSLLVNGLSYLTGLLIFN